MPTYDYVCGACGHALEILHGIAEKPRRTCPRCKKQKLERLISPGAGLVFKGSGFYLPDYRSKSRVAGEQAEAPKPAEPPAAPEKPAASKPAEGPTKPGASESGASRKRRKS